MPHRAKSSLTKPINPHFFVCVCVSSLCRYGKIVSTKAILDKNTNQCKGKLSLWSVT